MNLKPAIARLEEILFAHRGLTLIIFAVFTAVMGYFAAHLRMEAGYEKQIPVGHPYVATFMKYRGDLPGTNRLTVVVKARNGSIWTRDALTRLYDVTQAVMFLPNVDRTSVKSLWTPNAFVNEITEEGFRAAPLIPGTITTAALTPQVISQIQNSTSQGGYVGVLVSHDQTAAMVSVDLNEVSTDGSKLDYVEYNSILEQQLRHKFEDDKFSIQIIGFAKQIGDVAEGGKSVITFFGVALLLTIAAVYWFCHSWRLTLLPIVCSLTSLIWQFGTLKLMHYGLDPLGVLVPFLVFAIGVSHGVQQINFIVRGLAHNKSSERAARDSFTGLLVPGVLALVAALISFITLLLIPIPMIRELSIMASLGVGYKIFTNLVMLPLAASYCKFSPDYALKAMRKREARVKIIRLMAGVAEWRNAVIVTVLSFLILGTSIWITRDRIVGTVQPGAPELREDSRYNRDAVAIGNDFDLGLDWLTVVVASPPQSCANVLISQYVQEFVGAMSNVPGVVGTDSFVGMIRNYSQGYNEGYPKMAVTPIDSANHDSLATEVGRIHGYNNPDCSMTSVTMYLSDHKAVTIDRLIHAVKDFSALHKPPQGVSLRLAAGNAGVLAATNDELTRSETPMLLYVYAAIVVLVLLVYRDFRAAISCCFPLTVGTFIGYWFMKEEQIGLTVATLPVMVLAVGIGVDYALYIYNRLQMHLADGDPIRVAMGRALEFEGIATIFTALTLAAGVFTWAFSDLKFQADMGKLLAFMFLVNLIMAFTALPAIAVLLERLLPRKGKAYSPSILTH